ncbi:hypothetical protein [Bacillus sp. SM2101]|uniref:hypothetical protein n=1 Tax=Bacillus sp. SM2101 TaxID=2805366 RepID=UPI002032AC7F|nr:hypothetical protein [Bacillus sp. SM2101]
MVIKKMMAYFMLSVALIGCTNDEVEKNETEQQEGAHANQNEDLTKQLEGEEGVISGQVYVNDDTAVGTLVLEDNVSDQDAKEIAEKYADKLKNEYNNMTINVQAVRGGENVENILIEPE